MENTKPIMEIDLQLFAEADDLSALMTELQNMSGNNPPPAPADPPVGDPTPADPPTPPPTDPPPADQNGGTPPPTDTPPSGDPQPTPTPSVDDKANQKFAEMRIANKQYETVIKNLAGALGLDNKLPTETLLKELQDRTVAAISKQTGVPVELLQTIEEQKNELKTLRDFQTEQRAYSELGRIGQKYNLDQTGLENFVMQLRVDGLDPTTTPDLNFEMEFLQRNFGTIVEQRTAAAVKAEQERAAAAAKAATPPGATNPTPPGAPGKVESIQQLDNLLANFKTS